MSSEEKSASDLKAKGNALSLEKKYNEAITAYTDALAIDESNAVLFCNRAASYLGLEQFGRAAQDAMRATELDAKYTKAWSRLASAYHGIQDYKKSAYAWNRALSSVPSQGSEANVKMRRDYSNNLKQAERLLHSHDTGSMGGNPAGAPTGQVHISYVGKKLPWQRAQEMLPWLKEQNITRSSAYVIAGAAEDLSQGYELLSKLRTSGIALMGLNGALDHITNAIIMDQRCFLINDPDFIENINKQIRLESERTRVPGSIMGDLTAFVEDIRKMHGEGGHDASRPAIATGVRILILRGFLTAGLTNNHGAGVEMYEKVLNILEWGRQEWDGIPKEERGVVFENTFVRGVRDIRLDAYMKAWNEDKTSDKFTLDTILKYATEQLEETRAHPVAPESGLGFKLAFGDYMEGKALSAQAFYWAKTVSENKPRSKEERDQAHETLSKASELYSQAADKLPKDDEWYCAYKKYSLIQLFLNGDPLRLTLPLTDSILHDLPLGQAIWRWSSNNVEGELDGYAQLEDFQDAVREATEAGQIPPGSDIGVSPPWADPSIIFGKEATIQSHF